MSANHQMSQILHQARTIAVVGLTADSSRPSYSIAAYLQSAGYRVVPVNPNATTVLGERAYPDLTALPAPVDMALIFRRPEAVEAHVEQAIALDIPVVWLQPGARNDAAARRAREAGLTVVVDRCIRTEHLKLRA